MKHEYEEKFPSKKAGSMSYIGKKAKTDALKKKKGLMKKVWDLGKNPQKENG